VWLIASHGCTRTLRQECSPSERKDTSVLWWLLGSADEGEHLHTVGSSCGIPPHLPAWQSGRRDTAVARGRPTAPGLLPCAAAAAAATAAEEHDIVVDFKNTSHLQRMQEHKCKQKSLRSQCSSTNRSKRASQHNQTGPDTVPDTIQMMYDHGSLPCNAPGHNRRRRRGGARLMRRRAWGRRPPAWGGPGRQAPGAGTAAAAAAAAAGAAADRTAPACAAMAPPACAAGRLPWGLQHGGRTVTERFITGAPSHSVVGRCTTSQWS
jgi:hypothetical protein